MADETLRKSCRWLNGTDETGNLGIIPVARATEVPTQLYFCRLIQLCGSNNFGRYWTIWWSTCEKLKISPFDAEKNVRVAPSIKSLNHIIFSEHKKVLYFPHFIPSAPVICHVNRYIMHKCCLFFIVNSRSGGTFDMEAQRILMPFYFPWFCYQWDIFASIFFHVPPSSESKLFILRDDYLRLKKYLLKRLLSKSVQAWSLFKSKAWVEAYNGLDSLEETAFVYSPRHLCDTCEHTALWQGANLNQFKTAFEMPFDMPLCLLEKEWKENLNCNICHIGCPPPVQLSSHTQWSIDRFKSI